MYPDGEYVATVSPASALGPQGHAVDSEPPRSPPGRPVPGNARSVSCEFSQGRTHLFSLTLRPHPLWAQTRGGGLHLSYTHACGGTCVFSVRSPCGALTWLADPLSPATHMSEHPGNRNNTQQQPPGAASVGPRTGQSQSLIHPAPPFRGTTSHLLPKPPNPSPKTLPPSQVLGKPDTTGASPPCGHPHVPHLACRAQTCLPACEQEGPPLPRQLPPYPPGHVAPPPRAVLRIWKCAISSPSFVQNVFIPRTCRPAP